MPEQTREDPDGPERPEGPHAPVGSETPDTPETPDAGVSEAPRAADATRSGGREVPGREEVRARLRSLLTRPGRGQVAGAVLLGLLGFAAATQVHSTEDNDSYAGLRSADLVQVLNGLNAESRRAETELGKLRTTRRQLSDQSQSREAALEQARTQATTLGILAGTLPAQGPGIRVTVTDPDGKVSLNNLLDGIEELRAGGAEAIEVNDTVRVVAQTSFDTDGGSLLVDGKRVAPPYVLDVIGDPETLAKVLDIAGGFRFDVEANDGTVSVQRLERVRITSLAKAQEPEFAGPTG